LSDLRSKNAFSLIFFVLFYGILANIPFWTASRLLGLLANRLFCLEYLVLGLLALVLPRMLTGLLLLLLISADVICGISQTFYLSPIECLRSSSFLYGLSGSRVVAVLTIAGLALLFSGIAAWLPRPTLGGKDRWIAATCLVSLLGIFITVDFVSVACETGGARNPFQADLSVDTVKSSYLTATRLSRVFTKRLVINELWRFRVRHHLAIASRSTVSQASSASQAAVGSGGQEISLQKEPPNIVLVLVESWGLANHTEISGALVQPYASTAILSRYNVVQGTVPFFGATIEGESRELCGSTIGFHLLDASPQEMQDCLPRRLSSLGYRDIALHGMDRHFYDRETWYRKIGFDEQWFRDQFRQLGLPDCAGAFTGTCDAAMAEWIGNRLRRPEAKPDFFYWVTLNSHLPVPSPTPLAAPRSCSVSPELTQWAGFCSWYQLISNVHESVSRLAAGSFARPTVFIIVGDHAPPFGDPALRGQFSKEVVPYVLLIPHKTDEAVRLATR
jgi:hypothetical protein